MRQAIFVAFLMSIFCLCPLLAQETPLISYNFSQTPLIEALAELEANYQVTFSYRVDLVKDQNVTASAQSLELSEALDKLCTSLPITFNIIRDRYILLLDRRETAPSEAAFSLLTFQFKGRVIDQSTNEGLPFANLRVVGTGEGAYTDVDGFFALEVLGLTNDSIEITSLGYQPKRLYLPALDQQDKVITMAAASVGLADVVVTAYLMNGIQSGAEPGKIEISPEQVGLIPGQAEPDVLQSILLLPGVTSPTESVSDINIRGGTADQNLVLWDGIPVYHTGHYFGAFTAFNPFIVDQVDVWRGGFGAEYGGRVAGVIDIKTKNEIIEKAQVGAGLNLTHGHLYWDVPVVKDKLSWLFSIRRSYSDLLPTVTFNNFQGKIFQGTKVKDNEAAENEEVNVATDRFYFFDTHSKLRWTPTKHDRLSLSFFSSTNDLEFSIEEPDDLFVDELGVRNRGVIGLWEHEFSEQLKGIFDASYAFFDYRAGFLQRSDGIIDVVQVGKNNAIADQAVSAKLYWKPNPTSTLLFGTEARQYDLSFNIDFTIVNEEPFTENVEDGTNVYSTFVDYKFKDKAGRWASHLGFRSVYVASLETWYWEPRISLSYLTKTGLRFKSNFGINHQFVNQLIEFDFNGLGVNNQIWALVDDDAFPALQSLQLAAGADWTKKDWFVDVEAYYRSLNGITSFIPAFSPIENDEYNQGEGRSLGIDFLLRKRWGNHQSWMSYSLSKAEYFFPEINDGWLPAFNDQRHRFSWVYTWEKDRLSVSLGWNLQTGKRYSPLGSVRLEEFEDEDGVFTVARPVLGSLNANRLPTYHRLDFAALYTFPRRKSAAPSFKAGVSIFNVYNQNNLEDRRYREEVFSEEDAPVAEVELFEKNLLPFTPNLFFRVEW